MKYGKKQVEEQLTGAYTYDFENTIQIVRWL